MYVKWVKGAVGPFSLKPWILALESLWARGCVLQYMCWGWVAIRHEHASSWRQRIFANIPVLGAWKSNFEMWCQVTIFLTQRIKKESIWVKMICLFLFQQLNLDLLLNLRYPHLIFFILLLVSIPPWPVSAHPPVSHSHSLLILYFLFMSSERILTKPVLSTQTRNCNASLLQRADTFSVLITLVLEAAALSCPRRQAEEG